MEVAELCDAAAVVIPTAAVGDDEGEDFAVEVLAEFLSAAADGLGAGVCGEGDFCGGEAVVVEIGEEDSIFGFEEGGATEEAVGLVALCEAGVFAYAVPWGDGIEVRGLIVNLCGIGA